MSAAGGSCSACTRSLRLVQAASWPAASKTHQARLRWLSTHTQHSRQNDEATAAEKQRPQRNTASTTHQHQYNYDPFTLTPSEQHYGFPLVTARDLAGASARPRKVRMLASQFIQDSLYNPQYGYFSRQAVLLPRLKESEARGNIGHDGAGFAFTSLRNERDFMAAVQHAYEDFERTILSDSTAERSFVEDSRPRRAARQSSADGLQAAQRWGQKMVEQGAAEKVVESDVMAMAASQVWHTPTELFRPHYAQAVARYLAEQRRAMPAGSGPLTVYEIGAGSGTMAEGILDYLSKEEESMYAEVRYNIVEISERLAEQQAKRLESHLAAGKVQIHRSNILDWKSRIDQPCFVMALEVLDNLPHDVVRFQTGTLRPYQAVVSIDESGDMHELWQPAEDRLITNYLAHHGSEPNAFLAGLLRWTPSVLRTALSEHFPFYPNLTKPAYLPTASLQLLELLRDYFPQHRLILSDFDSLPDAIEGINAPVVQTRFRGMMVPVTTYRVLQGFFDIFFPTNFVHLQRTHARVMRKSENTSAVLSHADFLSRYADVNATRLRDGTNPMLSWYANAKWLLT